MNLFRTTARLRCVITIIAAAPLLFGPSAADEGEEEDGLPSIEEKTEGFEKSEGLFSFYTDPENGAVLMEIAQSQLSEEFIAFSYTENGVVPAGHFRGAYRDKRVISFERYYDRIEAVEVNTAFYFDPESELARASAANISNAVLAAIEIEATSGEGEAARFLISADALFLSEALHKVTPDDDPEAEPGGFSLGELTADRSKFAKIKSYPENADIIVDYVFSNPAPSQKAGDANGSITDARAITVSMQHSLIAMPDDGFIPRRDDYRVGYFLDRVTDLTTSEAAPYRDLITRWRLEKKNPDAPLSDPVKPITWWIENTTPEKYREAIRDGVLAWNSAFEKAGISNAIEVKIQPVDADWDAGDIRYNVLRWTSSPTPPFGGYGPSFTNPRTGEIIGADIMLEYSYLTNRWIFGDVFQNGELGVDGFVADIPHNHQAGFCSAGAELAAINGAAIATLEASGAGQLEVDELVKQSIYFLMLHEVGHTLGLNHNMKSSTFYGPREIHDASVTKGAPVPSVMDYPTINIAPPGLDQGDYYNTRPGAYDDWAIAFGYGPDIEGDKRAALLARSVEPALAFGNDADDMRSVGAGIDPRVQIWDLSSDPVAYAADQMTLIEATLPKLLEQYGDEPSWQSLRRAFVLTTTVQERAARTMSRPIGGVYVDRTAPGATGVMDAPYTPVPAEIQKAAMEALKTHIFAADSFDAPTALLRHLQAQRRDFDFYGKTEDPKLHSRALQVQSIALDHLLNPVVMMRITDSTLYGNDYPAADMILDLNDAVFGRDLNGRPNAYRRNLQIDYLERLLGVVDGPAYDASAKAAAIIALKDIRGRLGPFGGRFAFGLNAETKAHRAHIERLLGFANF